MKYVVKDSKFKASPSVSATATVANPATDNAQQQNILTLESRKREIENSFKKWSSLEHTSP
jgi:hypothetical protein